MRVVLLRLWNLRNYTEAEFRPAPGTTLVTGPNGSGKSSLLEGMALFSGLSSPRTSRMATTVREGAEQGGAHLELEEGVPLEIRILGGRTRLRAGGANVSSREFLGRVRTVLFTPEDLDTVRGEPGLRRRALDGLLVQVHPWYRGVLRDYERSLRQRNAALRHRRERQAALYDGPVAAGAARILAARRRIVEDLRPVAGELYRDLAGKGRLDLCYRDTAGAEDVPDADLGEHFERLLADRFAVDVERRRTTAGPHRDDLEIEVDGRAARTYGSRGEQRTAALALRLSELRLLPEAVLLLDDVLSELDPDRRERVFEVAGRDLQTIVTATDRATVPDAVAPAGWWSVRDGVLQACG